MTHVLNHPEDRDFVERVGCALEAESTPRIAGRILGLLLLSPDALALDEIAEELQVSKASISTNARLLEQWGALERVGVPGDRRDYYAVVSDLGLRMLERRLEKLRRMETLLETGDALPAARDERIRGRFLLLERFHRRAIANLEATLDALRASLDGTLGTAAGGALRS